MHTLLDIDTDLFTRQELTLAKKQITDGKACGHDMISPDVIKSVDLDDIILDFCNKALINS